MESRSYYDVLNVTRDAPPDVVRAAYRVLCQRYHPDRARSPHATAQMQQINAAYAVIGNRARRRDYDAWLDRGDAASSFAVRTGTVAPDATTRARITRRILAIAVFLLAFLLLMAMLVEQL